MRKQTKHVLSWVLSAAMVLGLGTGFTPATASAADDTDATVEAATSATVQAADLYVGFSDSSWTAGAWKTIDRIDGDGTYELTLLSDLNAEEAYTGTSVFYFDFKDMANRVDNVDNVTISDFKIFVDGTEIGVNQDMLVFADVEEKGNLRLDIYNEWDGSGTNKDCPIDTSELSFKDSLKVSFTISGTGWGDRSTDVNPYYAAIGIQQSSTWNYRNGLAEDVESTSYDYTKQVVVNSAGKDVTISDAKIEGRGELTCTAKLEDLAGCFPSENALNLLNLNTNIPTTMTDVAFDNVTLTVDGTVIKKYVRDLDEAKKNDDYDENLYASVDDLEDADASSFGYYRLKFLDIWSVNEAQKGETDDTIKNAVPQSSVEVTFTVSGIDFWEASELSAKYESVQANGNGATAETDAPTSTPATTEDPTASTTPTTAPTVDPGTTTTGSSTSEAATSKVTLVSSKTLYIAAGNSTTLKYKVTKKSGASGIEKVTVKSSNTKLVKVSNVKTSTAKLTVPKTATKGKAATVTIKSGSKSAKVKVYVKNPTKKVKAAKKSATVKAKKTATLKFKLTNTNKSTNTTDTIKVTSSKKKVAKVTKTTSKKGTLTVKVKGLKKGTTKITAKVGSKKATMTVKVK
ncbi:MAG: hypothetical protein LUH14_11980 [Clostridiaceae bacterium]|nr:hypothetical protein [Clostridiaceae bacterium]